MNKKFEIKDGDISDGYHTFDELYDHRIMLFLSLINETRHNCYIQKDHFVGWDAIYINLPTGQISYHVPIKYRFLYINTCEEVDGGFYDGHTSEMVIERMKQNIIE